LQTGNVARVYADLLKLQALFLEGRITAAVLIVPSKELSKTFGNNIASFDRLVSELAVFQAVITVPLFVIGLEV